MKMIAINKHSSKLKNWSVEMPNASYTHRYRQDFVEARTTHDLLVYENVKTAMIYSSVINQGGKMNKFNNSEQITFNKQHRLGSNEEPTLLFSLVHLILD